MKAQCTATPGLLNAPSIVHLMMRRCNLYASTTCFDFCKATEG
eukprot:CAMPEP_0183435568 /NCGR_PEP_ID=MMETSP0370-20130417/68690_1 /TAXON_ID=268820 /ORGANISM="Peridinium aciculiferum, Strain PAER-2" /LENGTH=42 /DNA_ID= /DNA_START= /DNA_END= /DNA_ORIENTATION=